MTVWLWDTNAATSAVDGEGCDVPLVRALDLWKEWNEENSVGCALAGDGKCVMCVMDMVVLNAGLVWEMLS